MMTRSGTGKDAREPGLKPRLGISTCLLGENVRYDGAEKRDPLLLKAFGDAVEWVPICPEVECGMTVPRDPMHLAGDPDSPTLVTTATGEDQTGRMQTWIRSRLDELADCDPWGFVLKSRSPSCGLRAVPVLDSAGARAGETAGLFAAAVAERFPLLPAADERNLRDDSVWDSFIERLFCLRRYRASTRLSGSTEALAAFHAAHELQLMAHDPRALGEMEDLMARSTKLPLDELAAGYEKLLRETLELPATPARSADVLLHAMGFLERYLSPGERQETLEVIEEYRGERVPLAVPMRLLGRYIRSYAVEHLATQSWFSPHADELRLRDRS
ncbi:MAG: DUF523 and DUF1722 domain-containing protein [Candidatus Eisenbacteria bacterium]|nr:DUF523 and DUF1722 domain-containing protein [Candidatus Eisenbacteria bacterium]